MTGRAYDLRCDKCFRATPRKRLRLTPAGTVCPRCYDHLPRNLRRVARQEKEK